MDFDLVRLEQRPPDGGEVAEVTLDLLLQVERPDVLVKRAHYAISVDVRSTPVWRGRPLFLNYFLVRVHHVVVHDEGTLGGKAAALLHAPQAHVLFLHVRLQEIRAGLGGGQFNRKTIGSTFGPVDSCGQVRYFDPSLVNSRNLSQIGQVGPVDSCGQVGYLDPSLVK